MLERLVNGYLPDTATHLRARPSWDNAPREGPITSPSRMFALGFSSLFVTGPILSVTDTMFRSPLLVLGVLMVAGRSMLDVAAREAGAGIQSTAVSGVGLVLLGPLCAWFAYLGLSPRIALSEAMSYRFVTEVVLLAILYVLASPIAGALFGRYREGYGPRLHATTRVVQGALASLVLASVAAPARRFHAPRDWIVGASIGLGLSLLIGARRRRLDAEPWVLPSASAPLQGAYRDAQRSEPSGALTAHEVAIARAASLAGCDATSLAALTLLGTPLAVAATYALLR